MSQKVYEIGMQYPSFHMASNQIMQETGMTYDEAKSTFIDEFNKNYNVDESQFAARHDWSEFESLHPMDRK